VTADGTVAVIESLTVTVTFDYTITMAETRPMWIPLESNPDVLTKYIQKLGVTCGELVDVFSFDEDVLDCIANVKAVILLFPCTPESYERRKEIAGENEADKPETLPEMFYMKQTVGNACGTIAVMHALCNNIESIQLIDGPLKNYLDQVKNGTPEERGKVLEESKELAEIHREFAVKGQTEHPNELDYVGAGFVAFIEKDGHLLELDGGHRQTGPIYHGLTTPDTLLKDTVKVCQKLIKALEGTSFESSPEYRFTVLALSCLPD